MTHPSIPALNVCFASGPGGFLCITLEQLILISSYYYLFNANRALGTLQTLRRDGPCSKQLSNETASVPREEIGGESHKIEAEQGRAMLVPGMFLISFISSPCREL